MTRWQILLFVTGIVMAVGACSGEIVTQRSDTRPINKGDEYVAIGDSYTAAPATGRTITTDGCGRTAENYPHLLAMRLGLRLKDVSCGSAKTRHVTTSQVTASGRRPPQADAISHGTDLVTVRLGGADSNALGIVAFCAGVRAEDPTGTPCGRADTANGGSGMAQQIRMTEERLVDVIKHIAAVGPAARIIVVGYPQFFPEAGPCRQLPLALGDFAFAYRVNKLLVSAQKRAAQRTKVEYLDVFTASRDHDMCAQDPWIAGLHPTRSDATPLHPYPEEQQLVADLLLDKVTRTARPTREQPSGR